MSDPNVKFKINIDTKASQKNVDMLMAVIGDFDAEMISVQKTSDKTSKKVKKSFFDMSKAFNVFAGVTAGGLVLDAIRGITSAVVGMGKSLATTAINGAVMLENMTTQFTVLTGSAQTARNMVQDLTEFSASTPFQLNDISDAASKLLSFGIEAGEVKERLREIGDVAAAANVPLGDIALIFGQVEVAGKLTGERLLQLQERGIGGIGKAIAREMGVAETAITKLVSEGKVTTEIFNKAFASMSAEGGMAFEGMIRKSKTFDGAISTLTDNFTLKMAEIGQSVLPVTKELALAATAAIKAFDAKVVTDWIQNGILVAIDAVKFFAASINPVVAVTRVLWNSFQIVFKFIQNGINIVSGAIAGMATIWLFNLEKMISVLPDSIVPDGWIEGINTARQAMGETAKGLALDVGETAVSMVGDFEDIGNSFEGVISAENLANLNAKLDQAKQAVTSAAVEVADETVAIKKATGEREIAAEVEKNEKLDALLEERRIAEEELRIAMEAEDLARRDTKFAQMVNDLGKEKAIRYQAEKNIITDQKELDRIKVKQHIDTTKAKLKAEKDFQDAVKAERAKDLTNFSTTTQALGQIAALGGKKHFKIMKALNLASSISAGIQAVQLALATPPGFPLNAGSVIAAGAMAAANVARVASQRPPAFEQGGIVGGNSYTGDRVNARVNSGEMILNKGQQKQLFKMANGAGGGSQTFNITVQSVLDGQVVAESVSRQVANGMILGEVQ